MGPVRKEWKSKNVPIDITANTSPDASMQPKEISLERNKIIIPN